MQIASPVDHALSESDLKILGLKIKSMSTGVATKRLGQQSELSWTTQKAETRAATDFATSEVAAVTHAMLQQLPPKSHICLSAEDTRSSIVDLALECLWWGEHSSDTLRNE